MCRDYGQRIYTVNPLGYLYRATYTYIFVFKEIDLVALYKLKSVHI